MGMVCAGAVADSWKGLRLGRFMEKVCAVEDSRKKGFLRYGGFMARARTRMVGGGSCTFAVLL